MNYQKFNEALKNWSSVTIVSHKSPDGDAVGSLLGMGHFLKALGKKVHMVLPDYPPSNLRWLNGYDEVIHFNQYPEKVEEAFQDSDVILCLDFNAFKRVGNEFGELLEKFPAQKAMIDHHPYPDHFSDFDLSIPAFCSTAEIIVDFIVECHSELLNEEIGTPLYLGIMTDSGSFRFSSVRPQTHILLAELMKKGVKHHLVHQNVFDTNTMDRLKLRGFLQSEKLKVIADGKVAYISVSKEELKKYNYQTGDTEGLVNAALSLKGVEIACFFSEKEEGVKISFRSKGNLPVNSLAGDHFQGGGHKNAAGGFSEASLDETIAKFESVVENYL